MAPGTPPRCSAAGNATCTAEPAQAAHAPARADPVTEELSALGLLARDVHHPGNAELVGAHAELVAPHLLLQRHGDRARLGELLPVLLQVGRVVSAQADRDVSRA